MRLLLAVSFVAGLVMAIDTLLVLRRRRAHTESATLKVPVAVWVTGLGLSLSLSLFLLSAAWLLYVSGVNPGEEVNLPERLRQFTAFDLDFPGAYYRDRPADIRDRSHFALSTASSHNKVSVLLARLKTINGLWQSDGISFAIDGMPINAQFASPPAKAIGESIRVLADNTSADQDAEIVVLAEVPRATLQKGKLLQARVGASVQYPVRVGQGKFALQSSQFDRSFHMVVLEGDEYQRLVEWHSYRRRLGEAEEGRSKFLWILTYLWGAVALACYLRFRREYARFRRDGQTVSSNEAIP